jgi:adenylate cyclase
MLVFLLLINFSAAQQYKVDSLKSQLQHASPTEKIILNYRLASSYEKSYPDTALVYYQDGLSLSNSMKNDTLIAKGLNSIGYIYFILGKYNDAIDYLFKALKIFESSSLDKNKIQCLQYIGIAYNEQGMYDKAMAYSKQAMDIAKSIHDNYSTAVSMTMIGSIYYSQSNNDMALDYFQQALNIMEESHDKQGISDALNNVALIYEKQKKFDKALEMHLRSLKLAIELQDKRGAAASYHNIGMVYYSLEKYNTAILYLDSCINFAKEADDKFYIKESYNTLSELYAKMGKYDLAYQTHLQYSRVNDTLMNDETKKQFAEMSTKYESEKKDNQISLLNKDKEIQQQKMKQQRLIRNGFICGFIIVLFSAGLFFKQRNRISKEKKRSDELLLNILPEEVAEELKAKGSAEAKQFDQVTVMFTDFKGFTQISEKLSPKELVAEIDHCFKAFDRIITSHNIEKIKTIGDSYMCAGGLPAGNTTNATDVVKAALEIQEFMQQHLTHRKKENKEPFEIRIGIHTGPVVAGIVGVKKFAYDIWGDTVNIASRMESSGEAGKVNISGATFELVKDRFRCSHRGKIQAKNKGEIDMYFIERPV